MSIFTKSQVFNNSIRVGLIIMLLFLVMPIMVQATNLPDEYNRLYEYSKSESLLKLIPNDGAKLLEKANLNRIDADLLINLKPMEFISNIFDGLISYIQRPFSMFLVCLSIIFLSAILSGINTAEHSYNKAYNIVTVLAISGTIISSMSETIVNVASLLKQTSMYMLGFIPIYCGIITSNGMPLRAVGFNAFLMVAVQIVSQITTTVLVPLLGIYLAFCLIGAATQELDIVNIAKSVRNFSVTVLGFITTIFVGLLSIQTAIAASGDSVALKASKLAFSTFVPVVGSAIGDALASIQGCISILRASVGGFTILAISLSFLPTLISIIATLLLLNLSGAISEMLGVTQIATLIKATSSVLSLLLGIVIIFLILIIISIGLMLTG